MEKDLTSAVTDALANFTGEDNIDPNITELVAHRVAKALSAANEGNWREFTMWLESSSTYVQSDLDELALQDYVGELETQLEIWELL